jgi:hypothetical protein
MKASKSHQFEWLMVLPIGCTSVPVVVVEVVARSH